MAPTAPASSTPAVVLSGPLTLQPIKANVYSEHMADGANVGNLKRVGTVWKFKAVGQGYSGGLYALCMQHGVNIG